MERPELPEALARELAPYVFVRVGEGRSGAGVYRLERGGRAELYLKLDARAGDEAERLRWMRAAGLRVPEVVALVDDAFLVTTTLPGRPASELAAPWVVELLAATLRELHAVSISACHFYARGHERVEEARRRVARGLVDADDFDEERAGRSPEELFAELVATRPEREELVFCHGDASLSNVVIAPGGRSAGWVDVGRAGVADRYQDLALVTRELESVDAPGYGPRASRRFLDAYGIAAPDRERVAFYRLLDEFF